MKYNRVIKDKYTGQAITVDVYSVLKAFGVTCQAAGHGIKKVLCPGQRGHKGLIKDMEEGIKSLQRSLDDLREDLEDLNNGEIQ